MGGAGRRKTEGGGELPSWWMWEVLTRRTQRKRRGSGAKDYGFSMISINIREFTALKR